MLKIRRSYDISLIWKSLYTGKTVFILRRAPGLYPNSPTQGAIKRHYDVKTTSRCRFDVTMTLLLRPVSAGSQCFMAYTPGKMHTIRSVLCCG